MLTMSWPRVLAGWFLIMVAESILAAIRQFLFAPLYGALLARQVGVLIGSVAVFAISWLCIRWINPRLFSEQLKIGFVWVVLTAIYECSLGMVLGDPISSQEGIFSFINLVQTGMGFGLLFVLFAPALAAKARGFVSKPSMPIVQKLLIGVLLPVFLYALAVFITPTWPCASTLGPAGQVQMMLFFLFLAPIVALLNVWVLLIAWKKAAYSFLAGMCVPTVVFLYKVALSCRFV
jgi:hypothetical protein